MRSVYFVEQKQKSLLQRQLKKEKIIFKAVVNYVRHNSSADHGNSEDIIPSEKVIE